MPSTKPRPKKAVPITPSPAVTNSLQAEVLTLNEAAAYLRLSEAEVVHLVSTQDLPGRQSGTEWRFLTTAIQHWLRTGPRSKSNKEAWTALAGAWKNDPFREEMLKEISKQHGRPLVEDES